MKILVMGRAIPHNPGGSTAQQLVCGFEEAGHEAMFYGCFYMQPYRLLGVQEAYHQKFDLVVYTEMTDGMPSYAEIFRSSERLRSTPKLYWDFDSSYHPTLSLAYAAELPFDAYLVGNRYYIDTFQKQFNKPVLHLPYACSPTIHRRLTNIKRTNLLGFIGGLHPERQRLIEVARRSVLNRAWIDCAENVFAEELIKRTNASCAILHSNQEACKGLSPGRVWESTGCGSTLLMDATSYDDFVQFLSDDARECIFKYESDEDIIRWINQWQNQWSSLQLLGDTIQHYMYKNHTYKNRAEAIIGFAKENGLVG